MVIFARKPQLILGRGITEDDIPILTDAKYPNALLLDGSRAMTGHLEMNEHNIDLGSTARTIYGGDCAISIGGTGVYLQNRAKTAYQNFYCQLFSAQGNSEAKGYLLIGTDFYFGKSRATADIKGWTGAAWVDVAQMIRAATPYLQILHAGDITSLAGKTLTWNGPAVVSGSFSVTGSQTINMGDNHLLYTPTHHIIHVTLEAGATDVYIETVPSGSFDQDLHYDKVVVSVDAAPGAGKSVAVSVTDGTNTMTATVSDTATSASTTTNNFDLDVSEEDLAITYTETAGSSSTRATIVVVHHHITNV